METYIVIIDQTTTPSGSLYGAFVPDVPGCTAMGTKPDAVLSDIRRCLRNALLCRLQQGVALPRAKSLDALCLEFAEAGEELVSKQGMVIMLEVSPEIVVGTVPRYVALAA